MLVTQRIRGLYSLFILVQILLVSAAFWAHFSLVGTYYSEWAIPERYIIYFILIITGLGLEALYRYRKEAGLLQTGFVRKHQIALVQCLAAATPVFFFLVATKDQAISRVFLFSFGLVLYLLLLSTSHFIPPMLARRAFRGLQKENTLLVGSSKKALALTSWLERKAELGINPVGLLANEKESEVPGLKRLGGTDDLERVVRERQVTQVILVEFPAVTQFLNIMIELCENLGVRLLVVSDLEEKFRHPIMYSEEDGVHFLSLREESLENPFNRGLKRLLDIGVALPVVLLILPPLSLVVWLCQRWQSPGPLFFVQPRSGMQNRPFNIVKFRTMHPENPQEARQATEGDARVFRAGRWFRKYSVDEMPQFWNVLRGDMSVVGPRPHLLEHNDQFARLMRNYHVRAWIKPGITGLAQVRGFRGETRTEDKLKHRIESDLYYLENWSLALDVSIIARTAWQLFFPPATAY